MHLKCPRRTAEVKTNIDVEDLGLGRNDRTRVFLDDQSLELSQRILFAQGALFNMGLTKSFAPYVFLFGHAGESANNPTNRP